MKKILLCFVIFASAMLFYYSYDSYNLINYARILNISNQMSKTSQFCNLDFVNLNDKKKMLNELVEFSRNNDIQFLLHDSPKNDDGRITYRNYIYTLSNDWIYQTIQMKSGDQIDFTNGMSEGYLSSDINDSLAIGTYTSYDNSYFAKETEVIQLASTKHIDELNWDQTYMVIDNKENAERLASHMNDKFGDDIFIELSYPHGGTEDDIISVYKTDEILLIAGCAFCIVFLILVCIVDKDKKEIVIRRANGQNVFIIGRLLYLKNLILSYAVFVLTFLLMWFLFIGKYNDYYHELLYDIERYCLFGIIAVWLLFILVSIYIDNTTSVLEMKNSQSSKKMLIINYGIKIGMTVILATPFIVNFQEVIPNIVKYKYISENEEKLMNFYKISNIERVSEEGCKEIMKYPYCNMEEYDLTNRSYFIENIKASDYDKYVMNVPLVVANQGYLKEYNFYEQSGQKLDLSKLQNKTLIIPEKWRNTKLTPANKYNSNDKIYVQSTGIIDNLSLSESYIKLHEPVILYVNLFQEYETPHNYIFLPKTKTKDLKYYETELSKYSDYFILSSNERNVAYNKAKAETQAISLLTKITLYSILYILFVIQFVMLYLQDNRKELSIKYMIGKSKRDRYVDMFVIDLCICLFGLLIGVITKFNQFGIGIQFIGVVFIFDSILITLFIRRFERKSIVLSLKGEY